MQPDSPFESPHSTPAPARERPEIAAEHHPDPHAATEPDPHAQAAHAANAAPAGGPISTDEGPHEAHGAGGEALAVHAQVMTAMTSATGATGSFGEPPTVSGIPLSVLTGTAPLPR